MKSVPINWLKLAGCVSLSVAACLSLYLACIGLGRASLPGCEDGSSCERMLGTSWAFVFGLPVSFPAFLLYSLMVLLSGAYVRRERTMAGLYGMAAIAAVVASAVWFCSVQMVAVSSFCHWCLLIHAFSVAGAVCLYAARAGYSVSPMARLGNPDSVSLPGHLWHGRIAASISAALCVGLLATGAMSRAAQLKAAEGSGVREYFRPATAHTDQIGLPLYGGRYHVSPADFPVIGSDAADVPTAVLLCDYCSDQGCEYLASLQSFLASGPQSERVIVVPVTQTAESEDIQRTVLTTYLTDGSAWRTLSALITSGQIPARAEAVDRVARKLSGTGKPAETFDKNSGEITRRIRLAASLLEQANRGANCAAGPVLISQSRTLAPSRPDMEEFAAFIRESTPPGGPGEALPGKKSPAVQSSAAGSRSVMAR